MLFAERLNELLSECKLSQKEIAEKLDIDKSCITQYKKGSNLPSLDIFYKLCIILDTSSDYLLGLSDF